MKFLRLTRSCLFGNSSEDVYLEFLKDKNGNGYVYLSI